jgi:hypothetical protein
MIIFRMHPFHNLFESRPVGGCAEKFRARQLQLRSPRLGFGSTPRSGTSIRSRMTLSFGHGLNALRAAG